MPLCSATGLFIRLRHFLSVTFLWLVQYFCRTWIHVLHIKHPLGIYWVLYWIFLMKRGKKWRNELNWKIDPDRCHAIFPSIKVITCRKYIRVDIFVLLLLISSFSSSLAYNVFVLLFCNFFMCNHKPISKESSLHAILWIGVYTRNTFTFIIF